MPDFTFTSPDGKSYTVSGPEGATKEQAFEILQKQIQGGTAKEDTGKGNGSTPSSGRTMNPQSPMASPKEFEHGNEANNPGEGKTIAGVAKSLGLSTAGGAAAGALAPEILTGAGAALQIGSPLAGPLAPAVAGAGAFLAAAGTAARTARLATAVGGAVSGLMGEAAGQAAEAGGAGKGAALTARVVGGMGGSEIAGLLAGYVSKSGKMAWGLVQRALGEEVGTSAAVKAARANVSKMADSAPANDVHAALQAGVAHDIAAADRAAADTIAKAQARADEIGKTDADAARRIMEEGNERARGIKNAARERANTLNRAAGNRLSTASDILAKSDTELAKVGNVNSMPSDTGNKIREAVTAKQGAELQARDQAYKNLKEARDAAVKAKEDAGIFPDQMPEMKELKQELSQKLLNTKAGRQAAGGKANVTEPGVAGAYQKVWDAINNKRVQTGVDPETGNPTFQTFKTTFEALDHVRRKLGDVAFGGEAEGYTAIGQGIAKDLYGKLANIQERYAGDAQKAMQSGYSEATKDLAKFGTSQGKKVTAVDRLDPETFRTDPQAIAGKFFNSQQGVRDLVELTGSQQLVNQQARDFVAQKVRGMSAKQVSDYLNKPQTRDWMREVPGLQADMESYSTQLARIERTAGRVTKNAEAKQAEAATLGPRAQKLADKETEAARQEASARVGSRVEERQTIVSDATKQAQQVREAAVAKAQAVVKEGFPAEATRKLLTQGTPEELAAASRYLAGTPGGKRAMEGAVRNIVRDMPEKQLTQQWNERLMPMLRDGQLLPPDKLAKLDADVQGVLRAYQGKEKMRLVHRLVVRALTTGAGQATVGAVAPEGR